MCSDCPRRCCTQPSITDTSSTIAHIDSRALRADLWRTDARACRRPGLRRGGAAAAVRPGRAKRLLAGLPGCAHPHAPAGPGTSALPGPMPAFSGSLQGCFLWGTRLSSVHQAHGPAQPVALINRDPARPDVSVPSASQRLDHSQDIVVARVQTARDTSAGSACLSRAGSAQVSAGALPLQCLKCCRLPCFLYWHQHFPVSLAQVRQDWGIKESVGHTGWQAVMRQYLRQDRQAAGALAGQDGRSGSVPCRQAEPCPEGGLPLCACEPAFMDCCAEVCGSTQTSARRTGARTSSEGFSNIK